MWHAILSVKHVKMEQIRFAVHVLLAISYNIMDSNVTLPVKLEPMLTQVQISVNYVTILVQNAPQQQLTPAPYALLIIFGESLFV